MAKIFLVDDNVALAKQIKAWLELSSNIVDVAINGEDALECLRYGHYDLVILDWELPGMSGVEVCRRYREDGGKTPIMMLSGKREVDEKTLALDMGADDYMVKDAHPKELEARVRALLRRPVEIKTDVLTCGDLELNLATHKVLKAGEEVKLLPKEFALLEFFMRNQKKAFLPETLLDRVWSSDQANMPDTVKVTVYRLRTKLNKIGKPVELRTVPGAGYMLDDSVENGSANKV